MQASHQELQDIHRTMGVELDNLREDCPGFRGLGFRVYGARYPSSALFALFIFGVSLLNLSSRKKGYPYYEWVTGEARV